MSVRTAHTVGWFLILIALASIAISIPVDGLFGAGLALGGITAVWTGWYLIVKRGRVTQ